MTIGSDRKPPMAGYRAWAADQLGIPPEATSDDARKALLSRLRDDEFVPPRATQTAWRMLVAGAAPDEEAKLLCSDKVRADIDAFAASFFDLPIIERKQRWHALMTEADGLPARTARLQALAPGLNVDRDLLPDEPRGRELAVEVFREFLMLPVERAARRQAWQAELVGDMSAMQAAATLLMATHPEVAQLSPELVKPLANWKKLAAERNRNLARAANQQPTKVVKEATGSSAWVVWVIIGVLSALVRIASNSSSRSTPTYKPLPQPVMSYPVESWKDPSQLQKILDDIRRQQEQREKEQLNGPPTFRNQVPPQQVPSPFDLNPRNSSAPSGPTVPSPSPYGQP